MLPCDVELIFDVFLFSKHLLQRKYGAFERQNGGGLLLNNKVHSGDRCGH